MLVDEAVGRLLAKLDAFTPAAQMAIQAFTEDRAARIEREAALVAALQAAVDAGAQVAREFESIGIPIEPKRRTRTLQFLAIFRAARAQAAALGVTPRSP